jgi:hypothetical protein
MFKPRPDLWPHLQQRAADAMSAEPGKKAKTTPWLSDDVRDLMEAAGLKRSPQQARRREMRLLFC